MTAHSSRSPTTGYADRTVTKAPNWHSLVIFDILLNNMATGLFLVTAVGELAAPTVFTAVTSWAYPLALVLLLADFACLVLDLGDPLRFHHMLRVFKPSSPMSLGTWCSTVFSLVLTAIVALEIISAASWLRMLAVSVGLPFAFGSAAYKGVLFSTSAQPGWKDARWLGAYLVNSALMLGAGLLLVLAVAMDESRAAAALRPALGLLVVFNLIMLGLLIADVYLLLSRLYTRRERVVACIVVCLTGFVIPAGALLAGGGETMAVIAVLSLVLSSLSVRFVIVRLPHDVT